MQCDDLLTPGHLWVRVLRMDMAALPGLRVSLPDPLPTQACVKWPGPHRPQTSAPSTTTAPGCCHHAVESPGSWAQRGPVPTWSQPPAPQPAEAGQAVLPGALGRTHPAPAASAQASTLHRPALSPPQRGRGLQPWLSVGLWGTEPYTSPCGCPFSALCRLHFRKSRTLYPNCLLPALPTLCRGGALASQAREEQMVCSLPAPRLGVTGGTALEAPPCHPPVLWVSFLWRLLAGWLGPSCPRPPSFYLCWCLQFGVGSLGRQLRRCWQSGAV